MKSKTHFIKELIWISLLILISWYVGGPTKIYGVGYKSGTLLPESSQVAQ